MSDVEGSNPFSIFSDQIRKPVEGLAFIGHLEKPVNFCGHTFVLRTLRPAEKASIATAVAEWRETLTEAQTWANAHVGLALVMVDGDDSFCPPIGPNASAFARARLNYVTDPEKGWFQPTLDHLFNVYIEMENEVYEAVKEFQDLAQGSQQPSPPSAASSTDSGTSNTEISGDTPT